MAGYDWQMGMSNNACDAYRRGLVPASKIAQVPAHLVAQYCRPVEWHHSSKNFNKTHFYEPNHVLATFGLIAHDDCAANTEAIAALGYWSATASMEITYDNCTVSWIEWQGTIRKPVAVEHVAHGCTVVVKRRTATIVLKGGEAFKKRLSAKGFSFSSSKECFQK